MSSPQLCAETERVICVCKKRSSTFHDLGVWRKAPACILTASSEIESHRPGVARNKSSLGWHILAGCLDPLADETHFPFAAISLHLKRSAAVYSKCVGVSGRERNEKNERARRSLRSNKQQTHKHDESARQQQSKSPQHHNPLGSLLIQIIGPK